MMSAMNAVSAISSAGSSATTHPSLPGAHGMGMHFADLLTESIGQVGKLEDQARVAVDRMMGGAGVDVHQAMIATQKASMAFELALAVRNKAVQAYQTVMGMQF